MSLAAKHDLTEGSIPRHLVKMTLPMIWGILAIVSFQLVDAYYISRLGTTELAAISYTFPVTYGFFSVFIGFGVATSSVISRMIGEKKTEDMKRVATHGIILVMIVSTILGILGVILIDPIFTLIGANETELGMIRSFMIPYLLGTFFVSMPIVGNAALRATGDAITPAIIMTIAAVINAAINPLLIFGLWGFPQLELMGAAIGTILANFMAMSACLYLMHKRGVICFTYLKNLGAFGDSAKRILMIALPVGITGLLPALMNSVANHLLSKTGPEAVAAFGAATRLDALLMVILMALSIGMGPIIGQNWGARKIDRVRETVKYAIGFSIVWSLLTALILGLCAQIIAGLFSDEQPVQQYFIIYMWIVPASYILGNLIHGWGSALNAIGKPQISAIMIFIKIVILCIPAMVIGNHMAGVTGIFIAIAIVNCLAGLTYHLWSWKNLGTKWAPKPQ